MHRSDEIAHTMGRHHRERDPQRGYSPLLRRHLSLNCSFRMFDYGFLFLTSIFVVVLLPISVYRSRSNKVGHRRLAWGSGLELRLGRAHLSGPSSPLVLQPPSRQPYAMSLPFPPPPPADPAAPHLMRIATQGHLRTYVAFALKFLQVSPGRTQHMLRFKLTSSPPTLPSGEPTSST